MTQRKKFQGENTFLFRNRNYINRNYINRNPLQQSSERVCLKLILRKTQHTLSVSNWLVSELFFVNCNYTEPAARTNKSVNRHGGKKRTFCITWHSSLPSRVRPLRPVISDLHLLCKKTLPTSAGLFETCKGWHHKVCFWRVFFLSCWFVFVRPNPTGHIPVLVSVGQTPVWLCKIAGSEVRLPPPNTFHGLLGPSDPKNRAQRGVLKHWHQLLAQTCHWLMWEHKRTSKRQKGTKDHQLSWRQRTMKERWHNKCA